MTDRPYSGSPTRGATTVETTTMLGGGAHTHRRISSAAIFGGVILAVVVQLLLSTLGAGIGLGTVNVNAGTTPNASTLGIGAGVWWMISSCIAVFFGGYVAAWLAGVEIRFDGVLHGLITWGLATLLTIYLLTSALGGVVGGGASALGGAASAAGSAPDMIQDDAKSFLQPSNPDPAAMSPQDAQKEIAKNLLPYLQGGTDAPAAKERIIDIMAAQMKISHDEAAKRFDEAQAKLQKAKDQAVQSAKDAADASAAAASKTSFAAFAVLLLGGIAAGVGGSFAVQRRVQMSQRVVR
jgi:hypothetical protein